jgi:uncharacterized protein (DUF2062 family)
MLLGRRRPLSFLRRLHGWLWPHIGWQRAGRYLMMRLRRLPGTPHSIAVGFATGAAVAVTPFFGGHLLLACGLAFIAGGNMLAAVLGTMLGNPWTYPLFFAADYRLGCFLLGLPAHELHHLTPLSLATVINEFRLLLWPMTVGCVPLAAAVWVTSYFLIVRATAVVQEQQRRRREQRPRIPIPPTPADPGQG